MNYLFEAEASEVAGAQPCSVHESSDSTLSVVALALVSSIAWISSTALPYQVSLLAARAHVGVAKSSWISSAELIAFAFAAIWAGRLIKQVAPRRLLAYGIICAFVGCVVSIFGVDHLGVLTFARLVFGAGSGIVGATCYAMATRHHEPERTYAYMAMAIMPSMVLILFGAPPAMARWGDVALYVLEAIGLVLLASMLFYVKAGNHSHASEVNIEAGSKLAPGSLPLLLGLLLFYLSQGIVWALAAEAAGAIGVTGDRLAMSFTMGAIVYLPGAFGASILGMRAGFWVPIALGYAGLGAITYVVYDTSWVWGVMAGIALCSGVSAFALPYIQGLLALLPDGGRAGAMGSAAISFGMAGGPALGGALAATRGLHTVGVAGLAVLVISFLTTLMGGRIAVKNASCFHDDARPELA